MHNAQYKALILLHEIGPHKQLCFSLKNAWTCTDRQQLSGERNMAGGGVEPSCVRSTTAAVNDQLVVVVVVEFVQKISRWVHAWHCMHCRLCRPLQCVKIAILFVLLNDRQKMVFLSRCSIAVLMRGRIFRMLFYLNISDDYRIR
jgi:hypothetical protein